MEEEIVKLYLEGKSMEYLGKIFNKTGGIKKILDKNNIKVRSLSDSIKMHYKTNPDKHPWKYHDKFKSKPCENFKKILTDNNIKFIEEYSNFEERRFSIDIAIPEYKIGFEINGNQHYNKDGTLKDYYQKREEYLNGLGWTIYQIHFSVCFDSKVVLNLYENAINGTHKIFDFDYDTYLIDKLNKKVKRYRKIKKCNCGIEISYSAKRCKKCNQISQRKVERPTYEILIKEIKELGYVGTGKKYSVSDKAIKKWIRNFEKEKIALSL